MSRHTHTVSYFLFLFPSNPQTHTHTHRNTHPVSPGNEVMEYVQCAVCEKKSKAHCDFTGKVFGPGNSVRLRLFTTTVRLHHAWTHEQPLDERLWQPSFSGRGRSQWELTAGNAIATLSYYANAASANTGWIACPRWLPFRLETAAKRISCKAFYTFFYRFCGSELWCGFF